MSTAVAAAALTALSVGLALVAPPAQAAAVVLGLVLVVGLARRLLSWTGLLVVLALVVMLIPIRRYDLPVGLPFALEPYRVLLVLLPVVVVVALLVDPRLRLRRLGFGGVVVGYLAAMVVSIAFNVGPLASRGLAGLAVASVVNLTALFSAFVTVRLLLVSRATVHRLLMTLVGAGAVVGGCAVVERATGFNVFLNLHRFLPLRLLAEVSGTERVGGLRAAGSAGHPIALAAVLTVLLPVAVYLAARAPWPRRAGRRQALWVAASVALVAGSVVTVSRTGFVMLAVMGLVALAVAPRVVPALAVAAVPVGFVLVAVAPTALAGIVRSFLNPSALLAQQYASAGMTGSGRLADITPGLTAFAARPLFGDGSGSRIVAGPDRNAIILDNQYLSTALEAGIVGVVAVLLLSVVPGVAMVRTARDGGRSPADRDLAAALACAFWAYGVSLFFYDALGFYQALLVFLMLLAVAGWLVTEAPVASPGPSPSSVSSPGPSPSPPSLGPSPALPAPADAGAEGATPPAVGAGTR